MNGASHWLLFGGWPTRLLDGGSVYIVINCEVQCRELACEDEAMELLLWYWPSQGPPCAVGAAVGVASPLKAVW